VVSRVQTSGKISRDRSDKWSVPYQRLYRAAESVRPGDLRLFNDPFAIEFVSPVLRAPVYATALPVLGRAINAAIDKRWPCPWTSAIARTKVIDD
jgi:O-methyltransferase involved in polyketide biosynthesis